LVLNKLCIAAFIPAMLYYLAIFVIIDFISIKKGLAGLDRSQLPVLKQAFASGAHLFIPIGVLIATLMSGFSSMKSVFYSIIVLIIVAQFRADTRMSLDTFLKGLQDGIQSAVPVAVSCAAAGIIVGIVNLTGLGVKFSSSLISLSNGSIPIALFLTMVASIILGCGLPTTAVYIILASLAAPALIQMGVSPLAAHLFVFYFGCISTITPPVALTSYAAAGIGDANPSKTGVKAFTFGIVAYIVPFMFVFSPALLLRGEPLLIITSLISATVGIIILSTSVAGYLLTDLNMPLRILAFLVGVSLIHVSWVTDMIGIIVFGLIFVFQLVKRNKMDPTKHKAV
jgi:TRAP transporter 4TM/12TM fusion protein